MGCIPTKALLFNAELWDHLKDAKEFGIEGVDSRKLNWAAVQERKSKIVSKHAKGLEFLMRKNKVETVKGYGKLTGPAQNGVLTVEVTDGGKSNLIKTKNVILATGSEARMIPGLEPDARVLTNIEILGLKEIPKSLVIVGAGAVGVEFASIFRSFDTEVTILEMLPRLVPVEDEDVSKELARVYRKRGINFHTGAKVEKVEKTKSGIAVTFSVDGKQEKIEAEKILIAVGRKPRTENIGLEKITHQARPGLHQDRQLDADQRAGRLCHWRHRAGDAATGARWRDGRHCCCDQDRRQARQADQPGTYSECDLLPSGNRQRWSDRGKGRRGRLQREDRQVSRSPQTRALRSSASMRASSRSSPMRTMARFWACTSSDRKRRSLIAEAVIAIELEATVEDLMWTIHAHPTLAEAMLDASNSVYGMAINA